MASSASAPTLLENLPTRPPTPPQPPETRLQSLPARPSSLNPRLSLHTPPSANSPSGSAATNSTNPSSSRMGKRVCWSGRTEYRDAPSYQKGDKFHKSSPVSAPSSASSKPLKGILKPSPSPNPLASNLGNQFDGLSDKVNLTEMLDSTIKQLAGSDRDSKLDAYMMLNRALKASNNLPDRVALQDKMSLLTQFIQRDITSKKQDGTLDTSLVNHALNLLATFLHFQAIASTIASDFAVFIIEHCTRSFEDPTLPKDVVRHFMQVVAFQNFSAKVMSADRVGRLVASLHKIEDHLTGKSIVMSRLHIYRKLVEKSRNHMAVHADWIKDMFTDMLSSIRDIRAQAIQLGMDAGFSFRPGHQMMRRVAEILQTSNETQTYIDFYISRLFEMVKDKQRSAAVPQIWSVITLFLRCPLDRWEYYAPWFSLIQAAFNTSDSQTKQEANYAWNRYVFLSLMDNKPTPKLLATLCQPLMSQLRRKPSAKQPEESKKFRGTVIKGICNLYYYAFRPGSERNSPPEISWDTAVHPVLSQLLGLDGAREPQPDDIHQASRILVGLLDASTPSVWNEDRIRELPPVAPEELPSIESKWIRKNSERLFKSFAPIMNKKFMDLANKENLTYRLWQAIVGSVAAASAKDIKVSEDTARFFACTFGLLSETWARGCPDNEELLVSKFYPSVRNFIQLLVDGLGLLPFTEKRLSMTVSNTFEPVATPSHRPDRSDKPRGVVRTPLQHLFMMLSSVPEGGSDNEAFSDFFQSAFEPFFVRKNEKFRLELRRELLCLVPQNSLSPFALWDLGAQAVQLSLSASEPQTSSTSQKLLGPEFREIASFLERGLTSHPNLPSKSWLALFEAFSQRVTVEFGDAGRAIVVIEPLAKVLLDELRPNSTPPSSRTLDAARAVFSVAKFPRDRLALDVATRRLWGTPASVAKGGPSDPFDNLYKLGNLTLSRCYDRLNELEPATTIAPFIESVGTFLAQAYASTGFKTLFKLQDGLSLWFQDEKAQLKLKNDTPLCNSLRELWTRICGDLKRTGHLDKTQFEQVEGLFTATFRSKHRFVVNLAADTWNTIVRDEESLECSEGLKSVVSSLRSRVDIFMPGAEQSSGEFGAQATSFLDSQDDADPVVLSVSTSHDAEVHAPTPALRSTRSSQASASRRRPLESTPEPTKFEPVASSSPAVEESQHLTERQKEIRERQRQNAVMYPGMQSSSPNKAAGALAGEAKPVTTSNDRRQEATPERAPSYGELISSTPTPRRGQVILLDGDNDPPSSPPEPRPYPLLSEIRSRSRNSSLENWNFSSPPGSPVTSRQQVVEDIEPPHVALTEDSTQARAASQTKGRKTRSSKKHSPSPDIIPSSLPETPSRRVSARASQQARSNIPATPQRNQLPLPTTAEATPKSGGEEFVDARSTPERSSPALPEIPAEDVTSKGEASFALSEGDESQFMKFFIELESRKCDLPIDKFSSPTRQPTDGAVMECITVDTDTSSPAKEAVDILDQEGSTRDPIPSTPAELVEDSAKGTQAGKKKKRKRGASKSNDARRKKRRSLDPDVDKSQTTEDGSSPAPASQESDHTKPAFTVKTRWSAIKEQQKQVAVEGQDVESSENESKEERDTDEELISQLMTESQGASQTRAAPADDHVEAQSTIEDSMDIGSTNEKAGGEEKTLQQKDGAFNSADSILERLRGGLDGLRNASLSRADVYQIEDMLMDMKRELFEAERRGRPSV
ncbi:hypothetical protein ACO1O0_003399 [Amphichorda felina]